MFAVQEVMAEDMACREAVEYLKGQDFEVNFGALPSTALIRFIDVKEKHPDKLLKANGLLGFCVYFVFSRVIGDESS